MRGNGASIRPGMGYLGLAFCLHFLSGRYIVILQGDLIMSLAPDYIRERRQVDPVWARRNRRSLARNRQLCRLRAKRALDQQVIDDRKKRLADIAAEAKKRMSKQTEVREGFIARAAKKLRGIFS